jgi:hypothetical protein
VTAARSVKTIPGGVTVRDYRGTGLCPPVKSGGRPITIRPLIYIQHIPVIHNVVGIQDGITLGNVLRDEGLNVANGTDSEGNIFLYTKMNQLCYHARGSNQLSTGTEHMHFLLDEPWTERQYRAAAWLAYVAKTSYGIPYAIAGMRRGNPTPITKRGHASHQRQAAMAGFNDRRDPGIGFTRHIGHVFELAGFYERHHRF